MVLFLVLATLFLILRAYQRCFIHSARWSAKNRFLSWPRTRLGATYLETSSRCATSCSTTTSSSSANSSQTRQTFKRCSTMHKRQREPFYQYKIVEHRLHVWTRWGWATSSSSAWPSSTWACRASSRATTRSWRSGSSASLTSTLSAPKLGRRRKTLRWSWGMWSSNRWELRYFVNHIKYFPLHYQIFFTNNNTIL